MQFAAIGPIAIYLPEKVEDNDFLGAQFPKWDMPLIYQKTGVRQRHVAGPDECASDLGVAAAERLFAEYDIDRGTIDFLLFCTQTPTTCCLPPPFDAGPPGLRTSIGALDSIWAVRGLFMGCLGRWVDSLRGRPPGAAVTAETYSKYIDPTDRSLADHFW